jgi:hypothetical protein
LMLTLAPGDAATPVTAVSFRTHMVASV